MTNKTIIDGIDVSECEYFSDLQCSCNYEEWNGEIMSFKFCKENSNCYFKQNAKLMEENEKLRTQNEMLLKNNAVQQWCDMYNKKDKECYDALLKLAKKEQECEELKSNNKILRNMWETADRNNAKHVVQTDNYKQALDEIEKYCISKKDIENINSLYDAKMSGLYLATRAILNIINEAKG